MNKLIHLSAAVLITLSSVGCAGQRHLRAGDAAYAHGDMRSALYNYQQAAANKSSLYRDPAFVERMSVAEARVAFEDAQRLQRAGRYEAAVQKLEVAAQRDPDFVPAQQLLSELRPLAAKERMDRAIAAADRGELGLAERELVAAAVHDAGNADVVAARASLTPDRLPAETPGLATFRNARSQAAERAWQRALDQAEVAIGDNPLMLPARALRYEAQRNLAASRTATDAGSGFLDNRDIGGALVRLNEAIAIWPNNQPALALLDQAEQARAQADARYGEANDLAAERKWDDAIARVAAGLEIDRSHAGLHGLHQQLPTRAAEDATRAGREHLRDGELDDAEAAFRHALSYKQGYEPAKRGMAEMFDARGQALEADGRLGAALLHYRMGRGYASIGTVNEGYDRNYFALRAALGMGLAYEVKGLGGGDISSRSVASAIGGSLTDAKRAGIVIGNDQPYSIRTRITTADIDTRQVRRENRVHKYIVQEWHPNPEHARLQAYHQREHRHLEQLCRQYQRHTGHSHHGHHNHPHDPHAQHLYNDIRNHERLVNDIHRQLRHCPERIQVDVEYGWDYVFETHEMTGSLVMHTELIDNITGEVIDTFQTGTGFDATDDTILNANPQVGLRHDPLELPDPARVEADMAGQVASAIAERSVSAIVQHRMGQLREQSAALREAGDTHGALEVDVQAAILLGMIDSRGMATMLDRLGSAYTR